MITVTAQVFLEESSFFIMVIVMVIFGVVVATIHNTLITAPITNRIVAVVFIISLCCLAYFLFHWSFSFICL
jgi:hypothetical protein